MLIEGQQDRPAAGRRSTGTQTLKNWSVLNISSSFFLCENWAANWWLHFRVFSCCHYFVLLICNRPPTDQEDGGERLRWKVRLNLKRVLLLLDGMSGGCECVRGHNVSQWGEDVSVTSTWFYWRPPVHPHMESRHKEKWRTTSHGTGQLAVDHLSEAKISSDPTERISCCSHVVQWDRSIVK